MTDDPVESMLARIDAALDAIRPYIGSHRGTVEVVDFDPVSGVVYVRLGGTCQGCSAATITLKQGIERQLRQRLPDVSAVEAI